MPEQQAWSSVSVCLPPPTHSLFYLTWSFSFWLDSLFFSSRSLPRATCLSYLPSLLRSHPLPSDKFILVFRSFIQSSFPRLAVLFVLSVLHRCPGSRSALSFLFSAFLLLQFFFLTLCPLIVFKEWKRGKGRKKGAKARGEKGEPAHEGERTSKGGETKSSLLSHWWDKMSEGAIIKLEFFNTVKNGALTAYRQLKGQAPTTHGEPPN